MNDSEINAIFKDQLRVEDSSNLSSIVIQIVINMVFTTSVICLFSYLRPRYPLIYAPKERQPVTDRPPATPISWFDWVRLLNEISDDTLLENNGFDAFVFIYFTRVLKQLVIILTVCSITILLPINIVATYNTGEWPPVAGLDFMSMSAINYQYGRQTEIPNYLWYWSPTIATWVFSGIVMWKMTVSSRNIIRFRQKYYQEQQIKKETIMKSGSEMEMGQLKKEDFISRTLLVHFKQSKKGYDMKQEIEEITALSCQHIMLGKYNKKLDSLLSEYKQTIFKLEKILNSYLYRSKKKAGCERPLLRLDKTSQPMDAINYYTESALALHASIKRNRQKATHSNYCWVTFDSRASALKAYSSIKNSIKPKKKTIYPRSSPIYRVQLAPHPDDIVWSNMNIDEDTITLKRWFGYGLFVSIMFIYCLPLSILAITSNIMNVVRLFQGSTRIIEDHYTIIGMVQSYFTPWMMVILYFGLPSLLHTVSRQQAYKTETSIKQTLLIKLYTFFVIVNLFIFTLVNILIGISGQIKALNYLIDTENNRRVSQYVVQIAKNMTDISAFWINYVCIRSVGGMIELLQLITLIRYGLLHNEHLKYYFSPRKLERIINGPPPTFEFEKNYSFLISFFTSILAYSVISPVILPFALVYFGIAMKIYKYKLVYIYRSKIETHGRIWPILYSLVMISVLVFQIMMILILSLKSGTIQTFSLIPLVVFTFVVMIYYTKYLQKQNTLESWMKPETVNNDTSQEQVQSEVTHESDNQLPTLYEDPSLSKKLATVIIYDNIKCLLLGVYQGNPRIYRILRILFNVNIQRTESNTSTLYPQHHDLPPLLSTHRYSRDREQSFPPHNNPHYNSDQNEESSSTRKRADHAGHECVIDILPVLDITQALDNPIPSAPPLDDVSDNHDILFHNHIAPPTYADAISHNMYV